MQPKSRDCAIKVTSNMDPRAFGSRCLDTTHVADFQELAALVLESLKSGGEQFTFSIRLYPHRHMGLTVSNIPDRYSEDILNYAGDMFRMAVNQFNWEHPSDENDYRFRLCQIVFISRSESDRVRSPGEVTVVGRHGCRLTGEWLIAPDL